MIMWVGRQVNPLEKVGFCVEHRASDNIGA
jgi:hypothetical protein